MKIQSKYEQIHAFLIKEIEKRAIGELLPCEAELSGKFSVNRMTVAKVMSALKSQGYIARKQGRGSTIIKKPVKEIPGVISVLPGPEVNMKTPYFINLLQAISNKCINHGYINVSTGCPKPGPFASFDYNTLNALAGSGRYLGAVIIDTKTAHLKEWNEKFQYPEFPVVWCAMTPEYASGFNCVDIDNRTASVKLMGMLYSKGYRKIGFISSLIDTTHRRERFAGYKAAIEKFGLELDEKYVFMIEDHESSKNSGYKAAKILSEMQEMPDAFFIAESPVLEGMKKFSEESGFDKLLRLPMVTFDYEEVRVYPNVIASVKQPFEKMAVEAFNMLTDIARGQRKTPAAKSLQAEVVTMDSEQKATCAI